MKNLKIAIVVLFVSTITRAQDTLVLQPGPVDGKDARLHQYQPNLNMGNVNEFLTYYWTFNGSQAMGVSLIQFDLSDIPSQMVILDAKLSLYHIDGSSSAGQAGNNASYLKKVTSNWTEENVTWNTMPSVTNANAVLLPTSTSANQNYPDIDITEIVSQWHESPENNYGLMLEIIQQSLYNSMKFASSDCAIESLRPKLVIIYDKYEPIENCMTFQPGPDQGLDARLHGFFPDDNFGSTDEFLSYYWTFDGTPAPGYSLIKFDISELPQDIIITSADLSLSYITSPSGGQAGNNACYLKKVISDWDENLVTWNTMPQTVDDNQVLLEESVAPDQNYAQINIKPFVTEWYDNPDENYGMMLKIIEEELYNSMKFASSDCQVSSLRPKLEICYDYINSNQILAEESDILVFPNPATGVFRVICNECISNAEITVYNSVGQLINKSIMNSGTMVLDLNDYPDGIYFLNIFNKSVSQSIRLFKN